MEIEKALDLIHRTAPFALLEIHNTLHAAEDRVSKLQAYAMRDGLSENEIRVVQRRLQKAISYRNSLKSLRVELRKACVGLAKTVGSA